MDPECSVLLSLLGRTLEPVWTPTVANGIHTLPLAVKHALIAGPKSICAGVGLDLVIDFPRAVSRQNLSGGKPYFFYSEDVLSQGNREVLLQGKRLPVSWPTLRLGRERLGRDYSVVTRNL